LQCEGISRSDFPPSKNAYGIAGGSSALALPYTVPRLVAVVPNNVNPMEVRILGGLPRLPGANMTLPGDPPRPAPAFEPIVAAENTPEVLADSTAADIISAVNPIKSIA
jgi:hypothetical protein